MKADAVADLPEVAGREVSLSRTLAQSRHVGELVQDAARELTSINRIFKQEVAKAEQLSTLGHAIERSTAVEERVQEVSAKLTAVNRALEREIRDRVMLDYQFAAVTEQEAASRHAAFHDSLTGLANRALFDDRLEHGLAQAQRHGWNLAVMFMDLDNFKSINDSNGHDVGDAVLRIIAGRLKENTRNDDTLSRHGGDEFLYLLMEHRDDQDVASIAQKIINIIQAPCNIRIRDQGFSLSIKASIGIALFPRDGTTANTLVRNADAAMYQAKQHKYGYSFAG